MASSGAGCRAAREVMGLKERSMAGQASIRQKV
jgi:hypothetical protein